MNADRVRSSTSPPRSSGARPGFTTMEVMVALGLLSIAMVLLSQMAVGQITERRRQTTRLEALEVADNILETARTLTPADLTQEWAAAQRLPVGLVERMLESKLTVTVEPYAGQPGLKRISVRITWLHAPGQPTAPIELTGYFGPRESSAATSKP
jgi:type II secretory pathway pseudopilin PulG